MTEIIGVLIAASKFDGIDFVIMVLIVLGLTYIVGSLVEGHHSPRSAPERPPQAPPVPGTGKPPAPPGWEPHTRIEMPRKNEYGITPKIATLVSRTRPGHFGTQMLGIVSPSKMVIAAATEAQAQAQHDLMASKYADCPSAPLSLSELVALNGTDADDWSEEDFAAAADVLINVFHGHHFDAWLKRRKPYDWATEDSGLA